MDHDAIRASFDKHRANPHVSIEEYVRERQIELGESVMARERVYLDKRYWIILRDSVLGRNADKFSPAILAGLRAKVKKKRSVCPISETVFIELLKQTDLDTRRATASLIDELSEGVTLLSYPERVATEIAHFLHSLRGVELYPLHTLVWTKLSYMLGVQHPTSQLFSESEQLVIQKAFFDQMWESSLSEMVDSLGGKSLSVVDYDSIAVRLNEAAAQHANAIRSFPQIYKAEIRGSLSLFMHVAREVLESSVLRRAGGTIQATETERLEHERALLDFFCKEIAKKDAAVSLRSLHIGALCHAAVRWDKKRKLTGNDLYDFHHAEAAVGYCDVFLTEQPLKTLLEQGHLKLRPDFPCRVISSLAEAAEWVETP
jgi:hypothetical protein